MDLKLEVNIWSEFCQNSPLYCTVGLWERHCFCIFMYFDPVFVFVGGMLRILWQWDPWWAQRPKTSETVPLFSPWDRVTHIFHTCYTKRGKTLETHITVKQTHVNWGKRGETWSLRNTTLRILSVRGRGIPSNPLFSFYQKRRCLGGIWLPILRLLVCQLCFKDENLQHLWLCLFLISSK